MNVIIVNSPLFREKNILYDEDSLPPIGLGIIATNLESSCIEVSLVDAVFERISLNELINLLHLKRPDFIATNIFTTNYALVKDLVETINYKTHFIIGGLSTKQLYSDIFKWRTNNQIDVVTGDGEIITIDIVKNQLKEIPHKSDNKRRYFIVDGNSKYFIKDISEVSLNRKFFLNEPISHPLEFIEANIVTSRGCIYNCTFCAAARSLNKDIPIREKSPDSIIQELKNIKRAYPFVNSIRVLDDLFLKKKESIDKAIDVFSRFGFQWRAMAHVMTFNNVDEVTISLLKKSGCYELFIGIESGSQKILKQINKTSNTETIINNLTKVFKAGINIKGYFIYGFPDETIDDMEMTYSLAKKLKLFSGMYDVNFRTSVFQYRPYHGTQIYHDLELRGDNLIVNNIKPNEDLSNLVNRIQFNFHCGNYSEVETETLHNYIYRTTNLNDGKIFAGLKPGFESAPK